MSADDAQLNPDLLQRSAISLRNAQKQGYLTKEGGSGIKKNWKKRWFILQADYLYYFTDDAVCYVLLLYYYWSTFAFARSMQWPVSFYTVGDLVPSRLHSFNLDSFAFIFIFFCIPN